MAKDRLVLSIDLGGTKILSAVINDAGNILARDYASTPASEGQDAVISAIIDSAKRVLDQMHIKPDDLTVGGIGAPGLSDTRSGILYTAPNLPGWKDVPIGNILSLELGKSVYLVNDANAAALGELYYGAAKGARDYIFITVSTGIGGGIIINGEIYVGAAGTAGELGHMVIDDKGPTCNCGNKGCWEILASGTAMANEAKRLIKSGRQSKILELSGGALKNINAQAIHQAAKSNDELARELIARNAYYLGVGLSNLINIFSPELIVIGGGLSNIGDMLLLPAYEEAKRRAFTQPYRATRFAVAALGGDSGILGVAGFALSRLRAE